MEIGRAMEDYLKAIYKLAKHNSFVRCVDVAIYMNLSKPSVSNAVKILKQKGYIEIEIDKHLKLTTVGKSKAKTIYDNNKLIEKILSDIGVDKKTAEKDACKMEHIISRETIELLSKKIK